MSREARRELNRKLWRDSRTTMEAIEAPRLEGVTLKHKPVRQRDFAGLVPRKLKGVSAERQRAWEKEREAFITRALMPVAITELPEPWPRSGITFIQVHNRILIEHDVSVLTSVAMVRAFCPYQVQLLAVQPGDKPAASALRVRFAEHWIHGEWVVAHREVLEHILTLRPDLRPKVPAARVA